MHFMIDDDWKNKLLKSIAEQGRLANFNGYLA